MRIVELLVVIMVTVLALGIAGDVYIHVIRIEHQAETYTAVAGLSEWVLPAIAQVTNCTKRGDIKKVNTGAFIQGWEIPVHTCIRWDSVQAAGEGTYRFTVSTTGDVGSVWWWWTFWKATNREISVHDENGCSGHMNFEGYPYQATTERELYVDAGCDMTGGLMELEGPTRIIVGTTKNSWFGIVTGEVSADGPSGINVVQELSLIIPTSGTSMIPFSGVWRRVYIEVDTETRNTDKREVFGRSMNRDDNIVLDVRDNAGGQGGGVNMRFPMMFYDGFGLLVSVQSGHRTEQYCSAGFERKRGMCLELPIGSEARR